MNGGILTASYSCEQTGSAQTCFLKIGKAIQRAGIASHQAPSYHAVPSKEMLMSRRTMRFSQLLRLNFCLRVGIGNSLRLAKNRR